jgi:hypothetical protein
MEGPKRHQAGERRVRRATRSGSSILRGTNVHASQPARHRRGTPIQRNRGFNPLGSHHARVADHEA